MAYRASIDSQEGSESLKMRALIDSGANVNIMTQACAVRMQAEGKNVTWDEHTGKVIATAEDGGVIKVIGRIDMAGNIGMMYVVDKATHNLISVARMQSLGVRVEFPARMKVMILSDSKQSIEIQQDNKTGMYFVSLDDDILTGKSIAMSSEIKESKIGKRKPPIELSKKVFDLHKGSNHVLSLRKMATMIRDGLLMGTDITAAEVELVNQHQHCYACAMSKWNKLTIPRGSGFKTMIVGRDWSMDYSGPFNPVAIGGYNGRMTFVESTVGYGMIFLVKSKTEAMECVRKVHVFCKRYNKNMTHLRHDSGKVELSVDFITDCSMLGISGSAANVEQQNQNPVERYTQTIDNDVAAMMIDQNLLGPQWWGHASIAACDSRNATSNTLTAPRNTTPLLEFENIHSTAKMFKYQFGQGVVAAKTGRLQGQESRNEFGVVVGIGDRLSKAILLFLPGHSNTYVAPRLNFKVVKLGSMPQMSEEQGRPLLPIMNDENGSITLAARPDINYTEGKQMAEKFVNDVGTEGEVEELQRVIVTSSIGPTPYESEDVHDKPTVVPTIDENNLENIEGMAYTRRPRRDIDYTYTVNMVEIVETVVEGTVNGQGMLVPQRVSEKHMCTSESDHEHNDMLALGARMIMEEGSPGDINEIMAFSVKSQEKGKSRRPIYAREMQGNDREKWVAADQREQKQLTEKGVFEGPYNESDLPPGTPVLPVLKVCELKPNPKDGNPEKVRWVLSGNLDEYTGDCFAPTVSKKVVWLIFAIIVILGLHTRKFDVSAAFVSCAPTRNIYVWIMDGIYRLALNLYGSTDAAKIFADELALHLEKKDYKRSQYEPCLFYKWISFLTFIIIIVHVDDFETGATSLELIEQFKSDLEERFKITSDEDSIFTGICIEKRPDGSRIFTKPEQMNRLIERWLPDGQTMSLPSSPISASYLKNYDNKSPRCDRKTFLSCNGGVMQLIDVRPDICFAVSKISTRQAEPRQCDMDALIYLIHYLLETKHLGLRLKKGNANGVNTLMKLRGYADAAFGCHSNGKSQYGSCFELIPESDHQSGVKTGTGMFYSKSWIAPTVDLASTESEMGAATEAAKDIILFRGVLEELRFTQIGPTPLYNDNKPMISLGTQYSGSHKRVRYMLPKINWLMEQTKAKVIELIYMNGLILPPDLITKGSWTKADMDRKRPLLLGDQVHQGEQRW